VPRSGRRARPVRGGCPARRPLPSITTAIRFECDTKTQLLAGIPVGRNGRVGDVADLITYLCREQTGYITGATYDVNGGSHIH
jgi:NAD(P)-dependent dehydrogenase (short-subunit alcohol dehydrogenase family)